MTLDDATKHTYRRADSATLLALLPELRRLIKRTQKELGQVETSQPTADGTHVDVDADSEPAADLGRDGEFAANLFGYSRSAVERERWVRHELKRRGLIPLWPGEQDYLDEDA